MSYPITNQPSNRRDVHTGNRNYKRLYGHIGSWDFANDDTMTDADVPWEVFLEEMAMRTWIPQNAPVRDPAVQEQIDIELIRRHYLSENPVKVDRFIKNSPRKETPVKYVSGDKHGTNRKSSKKANISSKTPTKKVSSSRSTKPAMLANRVTKTPKSGKAAARPFRQGTRRSQRTVCAPARLIDGIVEDSLRPKGWYGQSLINWTEPARTGQERKAIKSPRKR